MVPLQRDRWREAERGIGGIRLSVSIRSVTAEPLRATTVQRVPGADGVARDRPRP